MNLIATGGRLFGIAPPASHLKTANKDKPINQQQNNVLLTVKNVLQHKK
jgi:hypothetical protein